MEKRGQVTIFIIISVVIVGAIVVFFVFKDSIFSIDKKVDPEIEPIHRFAKKCVETTLVDGARSVGLQGGYFELPVNFLDTGQSQIAYGYHQGTNTLASLDIIERQISKYVNLALPICLDESNFPEFEITKKEANSRIKIKDNYISVSVDFPITISKQERIFELKGDYKYKTLIRLGEIHKVSEELIKMEIENQELIDLTYLIESNFDVIILPHGDKTFVYSITDINSKINNVSYTFRFANMLR
tara:strand:- start:1757 stop:2488 length:732 start_codon:yes stop_codon:yes gene_type:complete